MKPNNNQHLTFKKNIIVIPQTTRGLFALRGEKDGKVCVIIGEENFLISFVPEKKNEVERLKKIKTVVSTNEEARILDIVLMF